MSQSSSTVRARIAFLIILLITTTSCDRSDEYVDQTDTRPAMAVSESGGLPLPDSIETLIANRDAIVIGTVSVPGVELIDYLPTPEGPPPPTDLPSLATWMQEQVTDYTVTCINSLAGPLPENEAFILRLQGHKSALPTEMATMNFGEPQADTHYVMLLSVDPSEKLDPAYFMKYSINDMIIVDDSTVTYSDGTVVPYADGMTGAEFVTAVQEAIAELE